MTEERDFQTIKCPKCGIEYLPGEIFIGNSFIGRPTDISRSFEGKILYFDGKTMDTDETFICEHCGAPLKIHADVTFKVSVDNKRDFSDEYTSQLKSKKAILWEGPEID